MYKFSGIHVGVNVVAIIQYMIFALTALCIPPSNVIILIIRGQHQVAYGVLVRLCLGTT